MEVPTLQPWRFFFEEICVVTLMFSLIILLSSKDDVWMFGENLAEFSLVHELSLD